MKVLIRITEAPAGFPRAGNLGCWTVLEAAGKRSARSA